MMDIDQQDGHWFPGYNAKVEENRRRKHCNQFLLWIVIILAAAAIVCGIFVMQPGVVFLRFELGDCSLNSLQYVKVKGCGCGKGCKSEYPCYTLKGTFDSGVSGNSPTGMELYDTYYGYKQGCAWKACSRDKSANYESVYNAAVKFYKDNGYDSSRIETAMKEPTPGSIIDDKLDQTVKFDCYGDDEGNVIMTYINSSVWIGCGAIPLIVFVISVAFFIKFATPGMKLVTIRVICLPYYLLVDRRNTCNYLCDPRSPCPKIPCLRC